MEPTQWTEIKVRYDKLSDNGVTVKVTEPNLVNALSCTEAEARIVSEFGEYVFPKARSFSLRMESTIRDYEIESIQETKYVEVDEHKTSDEKVTTADKVQSNGDDN